MDDYDSDDVSLQGYTETKVLLGYAETEPGSDLISHLGGEPVLPPVPFLAKLSAECLVLDMATHSIAR